MRKAGSDGWFAKRIMRLTQLEKRFVNSSRHARRTEQATLSLLERITLPLEPACLEVGCGQGVVTRLLVECLGARVMATDFDPDQVKLAQERLSGLSLDQVTYRVMDARDMPFDDAQFDGVFSFQVLHHISGGWRRVVAETARVLRPGGWFVFTDLVLPPRAGRLVRRLLPKLDQLEETALHACLAENGLRLEHYEHSQGILKGLMGHCRGAAVKVATR